MRAYHPTLRGLYHGKLCAPSNPSTRKKDGEKKPGAQIIRRLCGQGLKVHKIYGRLKQLRWTMDTACETDARRANMFNFCCNIHLLLTGAHICCDLQIKNKIDSKSQCQNLRISWKLNRLTSLSPLLPLLRFLYVSFLISCYVY